MFSELDKRIRQLGFTLFDVARSNFFKRKDGCHLGGPKGQIIAGDAIYFRDIINRGNAYFWNRDKLIRSIISVIHYGYFDYAYEIVLEAERRDIINHSEADRIRRFVIINGKAFPYFKGRFKLSELTKKIARFLSVREKDHLGNW